jgi:hypothetical protein
MRGERCLPSPNAALPADEGRGLRVCVNIPGLSRVASQELFWPSQMGRCEGPPHSYVRMPFGLANSTVQHQLLMWNVLAAREARRQEIMTEEALVLQEPPGPQESREAQEPGGL